LSASVIKLSTPPLKLGLFWGDKGVTGFIFFLIFLFSDTLSETGPILFIAIPLFAVVDK
jgi:hypothetical protein